MRVCIVSLAISAAVLTGACGSSQSGPSGPSGTLNIRITDSPFTDAQSLLVTFSEVSAHRADTADGDWIKLPFADSAASRTCDLKKLQGPQDILGVGPLTAGHYTMVRLTVSEAKIYFDNPSVEAACAASIAAPSGQSAIVGVSSGEVKLNRQFDVAEGGTTTMVLDFDGDKSVTQTGLGSYRLSPVIGIVSVQ